MPFIHIKSLPLNPSLDIKTIIENISADFSQETEIDLEHITVTWEYFLPGHYAVAGKVATQHPESSHPAIVDLLTPDSNTSEQILTMLKVTASSISKHAKIAIDNIFINHRQAHSGEVFDTGEIVEW